jgi:hypothetical protein
MRIEKSVIPNQVIYQYRKEMALEDKIPYAIYESGEKKPVTNVLPTKVVNPNEIIIKNKNDSEKLIENDPRTYTLLPNEPNSFLQDSEGHCFPFNPYIVLNAIKSSGIAPDGKLNAKFVWAFISGVPILVDVNSQLFDLVLEVNNRNIRGNLGKKQLKVGRIYQDINGRRFLIIDRVHIEIFREKWAKSTGNGWQNHMRKTSTKQFLIMALDQKTTPESISKHLEKKNIDLSKIFASDPKFVLEEPGTVEVPFGTSEEIRKKFELNFDTVVTSNQFISTNWTVRNLSLMTIHSIDTDKPNISNEFFGRISSLLSTESQTTIDLNKMIEIYKKEIKNIE